MTMMMKRDLQLVTMNEIKYLYRDSIWGDTRKMLLRGDGKIEMDFTLPPEEGEEKLKRFLGLLGKLA